MEFYSWRISKISLVNNVYKIGKIFNYPQDETSNFAIFNQKPIFNFQFGDVRDGTVLKIESLKID